MAPRAVLALAAAAAALATWWALKPAEVSQAQPAVRLVPAQGPAQTGTPREPLQHATATVRPAAAARPEALNAAAAPLEHASGDEPGVRYVFRQDEGLQRRVAYQPEPMAMGNPFGAQAWGERTPAQR